MSSSLSRREPSTFGGRGRVERWMAAPSLLRETLPLPIPTVARQTPNHVHNQENHRNRCAGHEREVAPRMRRLGVVAVLELVHHCGGSFATTPSGVTLRSEEHTSELQSLMRISYAVFCFKKKKKQTEKL